MTFGGRLARRTFSVLLLVATQSAATDIDALESMALTAVNSRIECQQTAPGERGESCGHCDADYLHPFEANLPELVACEADHWLTRILESPALPECARQPLATRLAQLTSPWSLEQLQSSYVPQRLAIERPQTLLDPNDPLSLFVRWVLFESSTQEVELGREADTPAPSPETCAVADSSEVELVVDAVVSVNRYAAAANEGLLATGAAGLARLKDDWNWFLEQGLGQFPWERALNALTDKRGGIADLPSRQWALFHPSVALEIDESDFSFDELRVQDTLLIETLGVVRYRFTGTVEQPERGFWGASLLLALREDQDPGYGLLYRRGTLGVGAVWRQIKTEDGSKDDEISVVLTMDLLGRLQKDQEKYRSYRDRLARILD